MWAGTALDHQEAVWVTRSIEAGDFVSVTLNLSDMMHQLEHVWKGMFSGIIKHSWTPISSTPELHLNCDELQEATWLGDLSLKGAVILLGGRPVAEGLSQKTK